MWKTLQTYFDPAVWTPAFDLGDLKGPTDLVCSIVRRTLAADSTLVSIFKAQGIERMELLNPIDFRNLPRLQVIPTPRTITTGVGNLSISELGVDIAVRFKPEDGWNPVPDGAATIDTLLSYIDMVLGANKNLVEVVNGGQIQVATYARSTTVGTIVDDFGGDRLIARKQLSRVYKVSENFTTMRNANIAAAGG